MSVLTPATEETTGRDSTEVGARLVSEAGVNDWETVVPMLESDAGVAMLD